MARLSRLGPQENKGPAQRRPFAFGLPVVASLVVALAVAAMIGLGFWQISRAGEKEAALAQIARNAAAPRLAIDGTTDLAANLLRPVVAQCRGGLPTRIAGAGKFGFRVIGDCRLGSRGEVIPVQLGTKRQPVDGLAWPGGDVTGYLAQAQDSRSLLRQLIDRRPAGMMIVADPPLAGLSPSPRPTVADIPNNHRSYAFQWFAFAGIALIIYVLALRRRRAA